MSTDTQLQDDHLQDSPPDGSPPASKQHKRTYQACEPCRNRKVRCDLGSVDAPSDPPCLRCKREKKQCYFTETRRKRKAGESVAPEPRDFGHDMRHQPSLQNGFSRRLDYNESGGVYIKNSDPMYNMRYDVPPVAVRPELRVRGDGDEVRNDAAAQLFKQPIHQPGDALRLLVDAASRTETMSARPPEPQRPPTASNPTKDEQTSAQTPHHDNSNNGDDTTVKMSHLEFSDPEQAKNVALQTWARLRYVGAGWFTPTEGMSYLEYFTENLSNLTPTPIPDFKNYENHIKLLTEEPMMTVTLLTIASRYKMLDGSAGYSRSIYIHSMLWRECQAMVTRMFWGQEHFGGSFGLASGFRADAGEPVKRGLRALGTVEALLLLSDWHPRSMHFPPAAGNDDVLAPLQTEWEEANSIMQSRNPHQGWTEPVMRSDRMSWSLIGAAYNLAVELGVFDSMPEMGYFRPGYKTRAYDPARADRIGRLVHIYVSQTSGRLGYPNMLPHQGTDMDHEFFKIQLDPVEDDEDPEFQAEQLQRAWCELAALMRRVNNEIFRSKQQTLELIQSKKYMEVLKSFWPDLKNCLKRIESIKLPAMSRAIVMMEYEYARTYINSLALQAQIEQYAELANDQPEGANDPESNALFSAKMVEISKQNLPYITEVADATRGLLQHVVDDLLPSGGLKHAPVRTIFRILSGAMFLLKTFALGSKESDIKSSIQLLHRTVDALRAEGVDDCHLSLRIADLLASLIVAIWGKFVRVPIQSKSSSSSKKRRGSLSSPKPPSSMSTRNQSSQSIKRSAGEQKADIKQGSSLSSSAVQDGMVSDQKPVAVNGSEMPLIAPVVNPNNPGVMIMPPPDYAYSFSDPAGRGSFNGGQHHQHQQHAHQQHQHGGFPSGSFGQLTGGGKTSSQQKQNGSIHSPSMEHANSNGTMGTANGTSNGTSNGHGNIHPPMSFSPPLQNIQTISSPISTGSSNGAGGGSAGSNSYDWYAVDMTSLINQQAMGAGGNGHGGGLGGGGGGMIGGAGGTGAGGNSQIMSWGNMFGPEIGDSLELLNTLAADGLAFDDGLGSWNA